MTLIFPLIILACAYRVAIYFDKLEAEEAREAKEKAEKTPDDDTYDCWVGYEYSPIDHEEDDLMREILELEYGEDYDPNYF